MRDRGSAKKILFFVSIHSHMTYCILYITHHNVNVMIDLIVMREGKNWAYDYNKLWESNHNTI